MEPVSTFTQLCCSKVLARVEVPVAYSLYELLTCEAVLPHGRGIAMNTDLRN